MFFKEFLCINQVLFIDETGLDFKNARSNITANVIIQRIAQYGRDKK